VVAVKPAITTAFYWLNISSDEKEFLKLIRINFSHEKQL